MIRDRAGHSCQSSRIYLLPLFAEIASLGRKNRLWHGLCESLCKYEVDHLPSAQRQGLGEAFIK